MMFLHEQNFSLVNQPLLNFTSPGGQVATSDTKGSGTTGPGLAHGFKASEDQEKGSVIENFRGRQDLLA